MRPKVASISTTPDSSFALLPVLSTIDTGLAVLAIPVHPTYTDRCEVPFGLFDAGAFEAESLD